MSKNTFVDTMASVAQQSEADVKGLTIIHEALSRLQDAIQDTWPNAKGLEIHSHHGLVLLHRNGLKVPLFRVGLRTGRERFFVQYVCDDAVGHAYDSECPTYIGDNAHRLDQMIHSAMTSERVVRRIATLMVPGLDLTTRMA